MIRSTKTQRVNIFCGRGFSWNNCRHSGGWFTQYISIQSLNLPREIKNGKWPSEPFNTQNLKSMIIHIYSLHLITHKLINLLTKMSICFTQIMLFLCIRFVSFQWDHSVRFSFSRTSWNTKYFKRICVWRSFYWKYDFLKYDFCLNLGTFLIFFVLMKWNWKLNWISPCKQTWQWRKIWIFLQNIFVKVPHLDQTLRTLRWVLVH